jgi:II/X family phage/plasmid replication protein
VSIDSVKVLSPALSADVVAAIKFKLDVISRTKVETGEVAWSFSTGSLAAAAGSSIHLRIYEKPEGTELAVEASVHKLALGHNVLGNADGFQARVAELIACVSRMLDLELPDAGAWSVHRVDVALLFEFESSAEVTQFFRGMRGCVFPRRKVHAYGLESIYAPGSVTSIKLYHKGPEFKANGRELRKLLHPEQSRLLQGAADRRLRVEVEIKSRRLDRIGCARRERRRPFVREVTDAWLETTFYAELFRLLRERVSSLPIVRRQDEVLERLRATYSRPRAERLYGLWTVLSLQGEDATREKYARSSYYRNRKLLVDAGVAWLRTDTPDAAGTPDVLAGLTLRRDDPRRCRETLDEARAMLEAAGPRSSEGD